MAVKNIEVRDALDAVLEAVRERSGDRLQQIFEQLPTAEVAQLFEDLDASVLANVVSVLGDERLADILGNIDSAEAARLLLRLSRADAADVLEEMDPDDAADVFEELEPEQAEELFTEMEAEEAQDVRELMAYPPESAAGLMTREVLTLNPDLTAEQALVAIRRGAAEAETIYYLYVTDNADHLIGVVSLRDLVLAQTNTPISAVTNRSVLRVRADADQEEAARLLTDHGYLALPVVDAENRLLGIITADDVAEVLEDEATEDIARLGGAEPLDEPYLRSSVFTLVQKRVIWLMVLFVGGAFTSIVLADFEDTLHQVTALTFFIPLLIGTGGNVGSQVVATLVRAMGVGEITMRDLSRVLRKELLVALCVGLIIAVAAFVRAEIQGVGPLIGVVVTVTALCIVLWSATVSAILPLVLRKVGVDPAVVSAPLITTLVDATGLFIYLSVAKLLLGI
jgi:magnesium transporter